MTELLPFSSILTGAALLASCEAATTRLMRFGKRTLIHRERFGVENLEFVYNVNTLWRWVTRVLLECTWIELAVLLITRYCAFGSELGAWQLWAIAVACRMILYTSGQALFLKICYRPNK